MNGPSKPHQTDWQWSTKRPAIPLKEEKKLKRIILTITNHFSPLCYSLFSCFHWVSANFLFWSAFIFIWITVNFRIHLYGSPSHACYFFPLEPLPPFLHHVHSLFWPVFVFISTSPKKRKRINAKWAVTLRTHTLYFTFSGVGALWQCSKKCGENRRKRKKVLEPQNYL